MVPHVLDLDAVLIGLHVAMVMQAVTDLKFTVKEPDQKEEQEKGHAGLRAQQVLWVGLWVHWAVRHENGAVAIAVAAIALAIQPGGERYAREL